jgi:hypothetical protein
VEPTKKRFLLISLTWVLPASLAAGAVFATFSPGAWWIGWLSFSVLFFAGGMGLVLSWRWAGGGRTLAWIMALALILRVGLSLGLPLLLSAFGYDTETQRAGYVFYDAMRRDGQAWQLAESGKALWEAFDSKAYESDQYGGLLFVSAAVYRSLSPDAQRPLLVSLLAALAASFSIPFLWRAAVKKWGEAIALPATWIVALFPEGILLSSSQMREPFLITFSALVLWGVVSIQEEKHRAGWWWLAGGFAGMLLFSPGIILITLVILAGWLWFDRERRPIPWWVWVGIVLFLVVGLLVVANSWSNVVSGPRSGPLGIIADWLTRTIKMNQRDTKLDSGPLQYLIEHISIGWLKNLIVVGYGVARPLLPAELFDQSTIPLWRTIGIIRSVGWYAMLPGLVYGLLAAFRQSFERERNLWIWIGLVVWAWIFLASMRAGSDQWDSPRYRAILLVWQAMLISQGLRYASRPGERWLGRILVIEILSLMVMCNYYSYRFYHFGIQLGTIRSLEVMLALVIFIPLGDKVWVSKIKPFLTQLRESL